MFVFIQVGEALPLADASVDAIVGTLVLCSVKDVDMTLKGTKVLAQIFLILNVRELNYISLISSGKTKITVLKGHLTRSYLLIFTTPSRGEESSQTRWALSLCGARGCKR